jgi:hypothetical protein
LGREAGAPGLDGAVAQQTYLQPDRVVAPTGNRELADLLRRRSALEAALEALRVSKPTLAPEEYDEQLEKLLLELAQVERQIRAKT